MYGVRHLALVLDFVRPPAQEHSNTWRGGRRILCSAPSGRLPTLSSRNAYSKSPSKSLLVRTTRRCGTDSISSDTWHLIICLCLSKQGTLAASTTRYDCRDCHVTLLQAFPCSLRHLQPSAIPI